MLVAAMAAPFRERCLHLTIWGLTGQLPPREVTMAHEVHLVGSVPMASAAEVFGAVSAALGPRLKRIPDGETGKRLDWITWLEPIFADHPAMELSDEIFKLHATAPARQRYRLKPGRTPADLRFDDL